VTWVDQKIIDKLNREAARKQKKIDAFDAWLMKQKTPLSRRAVKKYSAFKLKEMRDVGIKFVGILGSPNAGQSCLAAKAIMYLRDKTGTPIKIECARPLPLPECDCKHCGCIYIALEGDKKFP
jgi:hypothetical protein